MQKFDPILFLTRAGPGTRPLRLRPKAYLFAQGSVSDAIYYLQKGRMMLTVVSTSGKEATIALLIEGDFIGEEAAALIPNLRITNCTATTACTLLKMDRTEMLQLIETDRAFAKLFMAFLLKRAMRSQADLVDQILLSSEKRLARTLLLLAESEKPGEQQVILPRITQKELAEMVGTTRSRVSFFLNRFRSLGLIEYGGRIRVHKSLLTVLLQTHQVAQSDSLQDG